MKKLILILFAITFTFAALGQKISELPSAGTVEDPNLFVIVQSGVTKKITYDALVDKLKTDTNLIVAFLPEDSLHWMAIADDIRNKNSGKVIIAGGLELPDLTPQIVVKEHQQILVKDSATGNVYYTRLDQLGDSLAVVGSGAWVRDTLNGYVYLVDSADMVGIGTYTPVNTLDVRGALNVSGGLFHVGQDVNTDLFYIDPISAETKYLNSDLDSNYFSGIIVSDSNITTTGDVEILGNTIIGSTTPQIDSYGNPYALTVDSTGSTSGIAVLSQDGFGVWARSEGYGIPFYGSTVNNICLDVTSIDFVAMEAFSHNSIAASFHIRPTSTNTSDQILRLFRQTTGTPTINYGGYIQWFMQNKAGGNFATGEIHNIYTTSNTENSALLFKTMYNGILSEQFRIDSTSVLVPNLLDVGDSLFVAGNAEFENDVSCNSGVSISGDLNVTANIAADTVTAEHFVGAKGYVLQLMGSNGGTMADATTYYPTYSMSTSEGTARIYVPKAGKIKSVQTNWGCSGTSGSNEDISLYLRVNSTDHLIQTIGNTDSNKLFSATSLDVSVSQGDYLQMKLVCPTWATNPTAVYISTVIYIE